MLNPMMMQNPMLQMLMQGMRGGGDPMQMLPQILGNNQQLAPMLQMVKGKSPQELETIARNLYKERGIDIGQAAQMMGFKI